MKGFYSGVATFAACARVALAQAQYGDQYWHERYHGILSMAAYGDYATQCPQSTFTKSTLHKSFPNSNAAPWTLLESFGPTDSGLEGFSVIVPEMDKVVIVFKGIYDWQEQFGNDSVSIGDTFGLSCSDCKAHAGAVQAYQEAKAATNNWAKAAQAVKDTGHQWSVTGHAFGGMVAQVASLDLGWAGLVHWSHNHGSPRVFNMASAQLYEKLFEGEAGQRVVANNDSEPTAIPEGPDYTHAMQGIHIHGSNSQYGMYMDVCGYRDDPDCQGGQNPVDTWYYYTRVGSCGGVGYSASAQSQFAATLEAQYANSTFTANSTSTLNGGNTTSALNTTTLTLNNVTSTPAFTAADNVTVIETSTVATTTLLSVGNVAANNAEAATSLAAATTVAPSLSGTSNGFKLASISTGGLLLGALSLLVQL